MTDKHHITAGKYLRLAMLAMLLSGLAACAGTVDRLSQVGSPPPLTPLEGVKTAIPRATHVAMPMPAPHITTTQPNSLWRTGARSFFKDQRASAVGDILTVNIAITDSAQVDNRTTRTRAANEGVEAPNLLGFESNLNRILPEAVSPSSLVDATST
ncbi:MAG TPA: flagellar basal body L-ring protein, partial [Alphaproteobacteria bacterium]|nr:flagellar basal body L-ring protein [Alphaproteobacteria bacterium]